MGPPFKRAAAPSTSHKRRRGLTLIELMLGMVVLVVAIGATMGAIGSFTALEESNRETSVAHFAARRALERMRDLPFEEVFAAYNEDPSDDPAGVVGAGPAFAVLGLDPQEGDPDGLEGRILLPIPPGGPLFLLENLNAPAFGLPLDLNADGVLDGNNRAGDYAALPVRVRVEWRGTSGNRFIEVGTLLRGS